VTKKEIVKTISESCGLTQLQTKEIVQKTFEAIIDTLVEDPRHRIELRNFGVFEVKKRAARKARNPRTGDRVDVPSKWVVTFKPGKEMEEKVLQLEAADRALETQSANGPDSGAGDDARHEAEVARLAAADATPRAAVDDSGDDLADAPASAD